jgi:hypothetical protein
MPYDVAPDPHGAWWYRYRDGTAWSRGPGERYDWWSPGPSQRALDAPWLLALRQQLEMRQDAMPTAHPIAIPPSHEDDANTRRRVTFGDAQRFTFEDTAVAETSGHPSKRATRVQNKPLRIRTSGGSPGSADRPPSPPLPPRPRGGDFYTPYTPYTPYPVMPEFYTPYTPDTRDATFDSAEDDGGDSAEAAEHVQAGA